MYVNRSNCKRKVVSWNIPNGTEDSIQVFPPWAVPPVELVNCSENAVYVITYVSREKNGQTANCSFNITVLSDSGEVQLFHSNQQNLFTIPAIFAGALGLMG